VNAYLADDPANRMGEFEDLLKRSHEAGLKVIIDFVPNHVSRDYGKVGFSAEHPCLGAEDDKNVHWSAENDFLYYPGQKLQLPSEPPKGVEPYEECPAMATGNNCYTPAPGVNDWYETIKINYCDFHTGTWDKMLDIVMFWAAKGVDGFRCDMVELVPPQFFQWLIKRVKEAYPEVIFVAEVYKKDLYSQYIREVGFDYLYDKSGLYDSLRAIVEKAVNDNGMPVDLWQSTTGITRSWQFLNDLQPYMLNFLENHDEQRYSSEYFGKDSCTFAALYTSLFLNTAPFMIYFGEEVGEAGMEEEGFSGVNGRTTIFDWWSVGSLRRLRKVIAKGEYKNLSVGSLTKSGLKPEEARVFARFAHATRFAATDLAITKGSTYDLCYCNFSSDGFNKDRHYAFLRDFEDHTLLVAANFSMVPATMKLRIPQHAFEWMEIPQTEDLNTSTILEVTVPPMDGTILQLI
jgi:glycosidase